MWSLLNIRKVLLYREIKEVELRSRRAQLVMTEIIIELGDTHAPSRLPVKMLRRLFTQKKKSKGTGMEGVLEKYHFLQFLRIHN